jgi:hypothetical protein
MRHYGILVTAVFIALFTVGGCGKGGDDITIPDYPGAVKDAAYDMGGKAQVSRYWTTDSYEDVLAFYKDRLEQYEPDIQSFEVQNSRQTKIDLINEKTRSLTVVIQQFEGEDRVAIVYMGVDL